MDLYLFTLCLGFGGLVVMALLGLGHGHTSVRGQHTSSAHGHGHTSHGPAAAKFKGGPAHGNTQARPYAHLLSLFAPQVVFSLLMGFGAMGMLLHPFIHLDWVLLVVALLGGFLFQRALVQPLWRLLLGFASHPAQTLDTLVLEEGAAATDFDRTGSGLVAVALDGQTRQILGTLCADERLAGPRVRTGDRLFIRAVNGARNTCTVSRLSC